MKDKSAPDKGTAEALDRARQVAASANEFEVEQYPDGFRLRFKVCPLDPAIGRVNARYGKNWKTKKKFLSDEAKVFGDCFYRATEQVHALHWEGPVIVMMEWGLPRRFAAQDPMFPGFEVTDVDAPIKATLDCLSQSPIGPEYREKDPRTGKMLTTRERADVLADDRQVVWLSAEKVHAEVPYVEVELVATARSRAAALAYALPIVTARMERSIARARAEEEACAAAVEAKARAKVEREAQRKARLEAQARAAQERRVKREAKALARDHALVRAQAERAAKARK